MPGPKSNNGRKTHHERAVRRDRTPPSTDPSPTTETPNPPRLLDRVRAAIRVRHYSPLTEKAYVTWIKRFIFFFDKRHPNEMGEAQVSAYISHLATAKGVSASTQNQALCALIFLYRHVLRRELDLMEIAHAKTPIHLPIVLSREEAAAVLSRLEGVSWLRASLMYGSGLHVLESRRLQVKDIDFDRREITVRNGRGARVSSNGPTPCDASTRASRPTRGWQWVAPATRISINTARRRSAVGTSSTRL